MGSRIAAHFANAGVPALLLDLATPAEGDRNAAARRGLEAAVKQKPPAFFTESARRLVTIGNFDDDLAKVAECDWVIEAIVEDLEAKRALWKKAARHAKGSAVLSTNTSGIPIRSISEALPQQLRKRFLGAHFFNPPRYLHLVELIPGPETAEDVLLATANFCDRRLGKGVVPAKDTPNFIANRIGGFFGATVHKLVAEEDFTVEEADLLTGPLIGLPNSASFRLLDIIGLDVWKAVLDNLAANRDDPWRERFELPGFAAEMLERGWLGEKTGQGFYRRVERDGKRVIEVVDLKSFTYRERQEPSFASVEEAKAIPELPARLRRLVNAEDRAGKFLWRLFADLFLYSAERVPEISDRIVEIDRAMRWGYAFTLGPFEMWDALGFEQTARRMQAEGRQLPENVERMLSAGAASFYREAAGEGAPRTEYFDLAAGRYAELEDRAGVVELAALKRAGAEVETNEAASLVDLGDGVLCVEFHSKMNVLNQGSLAMLRRGLEEAERNFRALVIANQGRHFSAGADLSFFLTAAQEGKFDRIETFLKEFQQLNLDLKYAGVPVVAAPFGYTLGGGCEVVLHAAAVQAGAELSMGLVEANAGLIPAGGGTKQLLANLGSAEEAFGLISRAVMSASAAHAKELKLLGPCSRITMNPERLVADAQRLAVLLAEDYAPRAPGETVTVEGEAGYAKLKLKAWLAHEAGKITDFDLAIAEKLAHVLSGGRLTGKQEAPEEYLLELEREAFLSLCGMKAAQERIEHLLRTGKPLRN